MNDVLQSGGNASISPNSLSHLPILSWHLLIVAPCVWFQHRIEGQRLTSPITHASSFLVSSIGIRHMNKRLNWSSSSLVSQTL